MWVVKIGGSLNNDPVLPQWLELLAQLGGGRVTLVCGGGGFADEVRRAQGHWRFGDLQAHNMAVLAMAQSAYLAHGLRPELRLANNKTELHEVLHSGHAALWLPFEWLRDQPGANTSCPMGLLKGTRWACMYRRSRQAPATRPLTTSKRNCRIWIAMANIPKTVACTADTSTDEEFLLLGIDIYRA